MIEFEPQVVFATLEKLAYSNTTWWFFVSSAFTAVAYFALEFYWEKTYPNFQNITPKHKKRYVVANLIKSAVLGYLTFRYLYAYIDETVLKDEWNKEKWLAIAAVYSSQDFVALLLVSKMQPNTIFHHWTVVIMCFVTEVFADMEQEGFFTLLARYIFFSTLAFSVNTHLGLRVIEPKALYTTVTREIAYYVYLWSCVFNWATQFYLSVHCVLNGYMTYSVPFYVAFLYVIVSDDLVLLGWLRKASTTDPMAHCCHALRPEPAEEKKNGKGQ